ncbi:MAG: PEP-CTERM sorting domain-containing protein [Pirellulales bacterium]
MPGHLVASSTFVAPNDDQWVDWTLVWETGANEPLAGGTLGIELFARAATTANNLPAEVFFDDLTLDVVSTAAVPEPSTFVGIFLCVGAIAVRLRRRG